MGSISHGRRAPEGRPRTRLQRYLEVRCGGSPKKLAGEISTREIPVSAKTAENLLAGHWPGDLTMAAIVRRFGADVLNALFLPETAPELAELHVREGELREELARMEIAKWQMGVAVLGLSRRGAELEDAS